MTLQENLNNMMGLDDIMISFAVSVGAGIATNLIEDIRSNKNLDARMNKCFNNALKNGRFLRKHVIIYIVSLLISIRI